MNDKTVFPTFHSVHIETVSIVFSSMDFFLNCERDDLSVYCCLFKNDHSHLHQEF